MAEPVYIRQTGEATNKIKRSNFFRACEQEARSTYNCAFLRYSYHPGILGLALVEGWTQFEPDQGEIRWQMQRSALDRMQSQ